MALRSLRSSLSFLTLLPVGRPEYSASSVGWFWFSGAVVALIDLSVLDGSRLFMPHIESAVVAVLADGIITRGLHYDAISDFGDGFFAPLPKDKRLLVMDDSRVGAFGAMGLIAAVLLRISAVSALSDSQALVFIPIAMTSRSLMAFALWLLPSAKKNGFIVYFQYDELGHKRRFPVMTVLLMFFGALLSLGVGYVIFGVRFFVVELSEIVVFALIMHWSRRSIDGVTGDVLGAGGLVSEIISLVAATAVLR